MKIMQKLRDKGKEENCVSKKSLSRKKPHEEKSSWQADIETRRYYYDDAFNYQIYTPENSELHDEETS